MTGLMGLVQARRIAALAGLLSLPLIAGGCSTMSFNNPFASEPAVAPEPLPIPEMPASIRSEEIVGRWGLASYQNPNDRART